MTTEHDRVAAATPESQTGTMTMIFAWAAVGVPLLWGVAQTLKKALALFS